MVGVAARLFIMRGDDTTGCGWVYAGVGREFTGIPVEADGRDAFTAEGRA